MKLFSLGSILPSNMKFFGTNLNLVGLPYTNLNADSSEDGEVVGRKVKTQRIHPNNKQLNNEFVWYLS